MSKSSNSHGGKGHTKVQNVGKVGKGNAITRASGASVSPENQRVSKAGHAPVEGLKNGRNSKLLRSGPITRSGS